MNNRETKSNDGIEAELPTQSADVRTRVKEIFRIHDNLPPFTKAEAVILDILSEEDDLSIEKIVKKLTADGDIIEGCNPTSVPMFLDRLRRKGLVTMRKQSRITFFKLSEKGRTLFESWKSFGRQFLSELDS